MKNFVVLIGFIIFPIITFGQDTTNATEKRVDHITIEVLNNATALENHVAEGTFTKNDVNYLSYRKSIELISIKAYRISLQIKVKEVRNC